MNIKQNIFSGSRPQATPDLLPPQEAQTAQNCKLDKGDLRPCKDKSAILAVAGLTTPETLYLYGDNWITSDDDYDFARSPVAADTHKRLYFTGANEPRVSADDIWSDPFDLSTDYYKLGVPAPVAAPVIDAGYATDDIYRAYVYSYVVRLGGADLEEGPPSAAISVTDYGSGNVTLSGFTEPPASREIGTIRIYRTNSSTSGAAAFQFVKEFQTATFTFATDTIVDDIAEADLGTDGPQPETFVPPPTGLKGLIALVGGAMAGFVENVVYISEPFQPHAWPYEYPVDATIIGLSWFGSALVALTDTHVYVLTGVPSVMDVTKFDGFYPCLSKHGIISDIGREGGCIFPSEEGWAIVNQNGVKIISKSFIDPTSWRDDFAPSTTKGYFYEEKIFAFWSGGAYVIDFYNDKFTTLDITPDAAHQAEETGSFYMIMENEDATQPAYDHQVYKWEGSSSGFLKYTWKSKLFSLRNITNFSAARILRPVVSFDEIDEIIAANAILMATGDVGDALNSIDINSDEINGDTLTAVSGVSITTDITFKLYGDGVLLHTETVQDEEPFRLPGGVMYKYMEYELSGYGPVREISIATSIEELDS